MSSVSIYYAPESDLRGKSDDHFIFIESFRCSISSVSIYYEPESDLRVISYDHLNFSRASVVQFRASRNIMRLNLTSELKVMTVLVSLEPLFFNFERLDISCASIAHHVKSYGRLNWTRASGFNYERLYILCA